MPTICSDEIELLFLGAFLGAAVVIDVRTHRIPNLLCLCTLSAGLVLQFLDAGSTGLVSGAAGLLTGFLVLLPIFLMGGMGAGDVKLMASVGTFLGASDTLLAAVITLVVGGVIAGGVVAWRQLRGWISARVHPRFETDVRGSTWTLEFPYAAAIAAGVGVAVLPLPHVLTY